MKNRTKIEYWLYHERIDWYGGKPFQIGEEPKEFSSTSNIGQARTMQAALKMLSKLPAEATLERVVRKPKRKGRFCIKQWVKRS